MKRFFLILGLAHLGLYAGKTIKPFNKTKYEALGLCEKVHRFFTEEKWYRYDECRRLRKQIKSMLMDLSRAKVNGTNRVLPEAFTCELDPLAFKLEEARIFLNVVLQVAPGNRIPRRAPDVRRPHIEDLEAQDQRAVDALRQAMEDELLDRARQRSFNAETENTLLPDDQALALLFQSTEDLAESDEHSGEIDVYELSTQSYHDE